MVKQAIEVAKQQFKAAIDIRNPMLMIGTIVGVSGAIALVGAVGRGVKTTTQSALEGDISAVPTNLLETGADWVQSQLNILKAISPLSKKASKTRKSSRTPRQRARDEIKRRGGM